MPQPSLALLHPCLQYNINREYLSNFLRKCNSTRLWIRSLQTNAPYPPGLHAPPRYILLTCVNVWGRVIAGFYSTLPNECLKLRLSSCCGLTKRSGGGQGSKDRSERLSLSVEDLIMAMHKASTRRIEVLSRTTGNVNQVTSGHRTDL